MKQLYPFIISCLLFTNVFSQKTVLNLHNIDPGVGMGNYTTDTKALETAIDSIRHNSSGGSLYLPSGLYLFNDTGIVLPDNIEIYGAGNTLTEIRNVNPAIFPISDGTENDNGVIFFASLYGPYEIFYDSIFHIQDVNANAMKIVEDASSTFPIDSIKPGQLIVIGSNIRQKNDKDSTTKYFSSSEIAEVDHVNTAKKAIFLKLRLQSGYKAFFSQKASCIPLNTGHFKDNYLDTIPYHIAKNVYIHDILLSQADSNLTGQFPNGTRMGCVLKGGDYNGKYKNLSIRNAGTFPGGNMFNRDTMYNVNVASTLKFADFGYSSANDQITHLNWKYKPSPPTVQKQALTFVYVNQGSHDITLDSCTAVDSAGFQANDIFNIADGATHISITNSNFNLSHYTNSGGIVFRLHDEDDSNYLNNIFVTNDTFTLDTVSQFIRCDAQYFASSTLTRKVKFSSDLFYGYNTHPLTTIDSDFIGVTICRSHVRITITSPPVDLCYNCSCTPSPQSRAIATTTINVTPNPVNNRGYIQLNNNGIMKRISIYNMEGQLILNSNKDTRIFSFSKSNPGFSEGLFFIAVTTEDDQVLKTEFKIN